MMSQEQNDLITRTGPKDPCGKLMRMYWQPAALLDELQGPRPVRPVKLLGENLVLFRNEQGRYGLIERHCAHRGADLALRRLWPAVPRLLRRHRPADDEDPSRIRPADHQCRAYRIRPASDRAARDRC